MSIGIPDCRASVVVVGSINADQVLTVPTLPAAGETVIATGEAAFLGGKGANQAVTAAALLDGVAMVGVVGNDSAGSGATATLNQAGVNTAHVLTSEAPTGRATIVVDDDGENTIVIRRGANELLSPGLVTTALVDLLDASSVVVASLEIPIAAVAAAATAATNAGARFVLNPAPAQPLDRGLLKLCTVLVPNEGEFRRLARDASELFDAGVGAVVVTRSGSGAELYQRDCEPITIPAHAVDVVDTTGAGDAFVAALAVALHDRLSLREAVAVAVAAGAVATTGLGAQGAKQTRARIGQLAREQQAAFGGIAAAPVKGKS